MADKQQGNSNPGRQNPDAKVRFCLSKDGLKLGVSRYLPPDAGGRELTPSLLRQQLQAAGVRIDPVPGAAERIVELIENGQDFRKVVLVRGTPAENPSHGHIQPLGDLRMPVFSGDIIARKISPTQGKAGQTIDGRALEPTEHIDGKLQDVKAKAGDNVIFDPTEQTFTAKVYGIASIRHNVVSVKPALTLDDEAIYVVGTIYHKDAMGQEITPERFQPELERLGVLVPPSSESIEEALDIARSTRRLQHNIVIAQGKEPIPGKDGWLEILVEREVDDSREDDQGRIDYRHRASLPMVKPGDMVARVHEPEPGIGGIDLYDKTIPAKGGKRLSVSPGQGIRRRGADGFEAVEQGLLLYEKGVLWVSPILVVKRDVGLATGHVQAEFGSVHIQGSVGANMRVSAPESVVVTDAVESARIQAGADVEVRGGILMPDGGYVRAGGKVMAQFATNARIEAGGDVVIGNNVTNATIETLGSFFAVKGKGVVQGGTITSHHNVEVNELGTEIGVPTTVVITQRRRNNLPALKARGKIKRELERIAERIGTGEPKAILQATPPARREAMAEVLKYRLRLEKRFQKINEFMKKDTKKRRETLSRCRIKVRRRIHPGVTIKIGGRVLAVDRTIDRSQIYWDHVSKSILITHL
ncbi:hypothetical protein SAMN02745704_02879 [Paucidesulfovibrio gracilis DSM 16080]|uniref:Flagellar Assembly Protein A N-terminal region domain-containing protein n=1 Tax=Paucidesulfovibrio gracilis DSM 16080 TaxID=1121449 RepID=A0A1T4Y843_9BACT|nr:hypothetical protein SAMN02745704_02879 [Paucidesulfovibrio gracilis DSM 16080]